MKLSELKRVIDELVEDGLGHQTVRVYDEQNETLFEIQNHNTHGHGPLTDTPSETVDLSIIPME